MELGPHHRAALTLRYLDDLPVPEVASCLGRSLHATETLYRHRIERGPGTLWGDSPCRQAVDGVLLAWADGQDVACPFVDLAIDQAEPLRPLVGHVELHPGKPGELTADLPVTEQLAGHPPVGEINQDRLRRVEYGRVDRVAPRGRWRCPTRR